MQGDFASGRVGIGWGGDQQGVGADLLGFLRIGDGVLRADGAGADDERQSCANDLFRQSHHMEAFLHALGVIFTGGSCDDEPVHTSLDQAFNDSGKTFLIDRMIVPVGGDDGCINAFKLHGFAPNCLRPVQTAAGRV